MSRAINKNTDIQTKWIVSLVENYPIYNRSWLLTGEGNMLQSAEKGEIKRINAGLPLIPAEAFAGRSNNDVSILQNDVKEYYVIPEFVNADFMIPVKGSSMYPKYNSGDIVACKIIKEITFFQWGRVYVVHHKDQGTMIKRLFPTKKDGFVQCVSDNDKYPAFEIDTKEITDWALVLGVVRLE